METLNRICGWDGCNEVSFKINPKTDKPYYYCLYHTEERKRHKRKYYQENKDTYNKRAVARWNDLKTRFLAMYGGICFCCHESQSEFLTLDHVKNDGKQHRAERSASGVYMDALERYDPDRFQILCYNCNIAKYNYGTCPHQL
jgi:5-methylcytosine-specific restriction endonuclease McrA